MRQNDATEDSYERPQISRGQGQTAPASGAWEVTAEEMSAVVGPLPAAGDAEGVTQPQPLTQCSYFGDSDLNEESPRGSHTYPLIPFYMFLLSLNPKLRVKGTAGVGDQALPGSFTSAL